MIWLISVDHGTPTQHWSSLCMRARCGRTAQASGQLAAHNKQQQHFFFQADQIMVLLSKLLPSPIVTEVCNSILGIICNKCEWIDCAIFRLPKTQKVRSKNWTVKKQYWHYYYMTVHTPNVTAWSIMKINALLQFLTFSLLLNSLFFSVKM